MRAHWLKMVIGLLCVSLVCLGSIGISQGSKRNLPQGRWTLSAGPYSGPGNEEIPVDIYSVTTNANKGLTVEQVMLKNRTTKDVNEVKLHWYLLEESETQPILEGETDYLETELPAGKMQKILLPIVTFSKIYKPLLKGRDSLVGNYRLEIVVGGIKYSDQSVWTLEPIKRISKVN